MKFNGHFYKTVILSLSVSLAGCVGGSYSKENWVQSNTEADWDIDSAVCLAKSNQLTKDDWEEIAEIKHSIDKQNRETQDSINISRAYNSEYADVLGAFSGLFSAMATFEKVTAEDTHKENKFKDCLTDKGWKNN